MKNEYIYIFSDGNEITSPDVDDNMLGFSSGKKITLKIYINYSYFKEKLKNNNEGTLTKNKSLVG